MRSMRTFFVTPKSDHRSSRLQIDETTSTIRSAKVYQLHTLLQQVNYCVRLRNRPVTRNIGQLGHAIVVNFDRASDNFASDHEWRQWRTNTKGSGTGYTAGAARGSKL